MKKKKLLSSLLVAGLCLALGAPMTVMADGQKVVTLGADLTEDQKAAVLKYFGVYGQSIETLIITNADERAHLGSYVPLEQIGTKTFSCALVCPTNSGGIQVKTANLSWVTSNMIATTLSTAGVVNCDVLAASPFEVSGTGALTGVLMAYETASGTTLDTVRKDLATQEMITTTQIASEVGQQQATNIVNEIKIQIIENAVVEPDVVEEIVEEVVDEIEYENPEVTLSDEDRALLTGLMTQIAEQQYDYEEMKETLQRVEENLNTLTENQEEVVEVIEGTEETEPETLSSDSILMNTDDSALGSDVVIDATSQEAVAETQPATEAAADSGFEITTSDSYTEPGADETWDSGTQTGEVVLDGTGMDDGVVDVPEEEITWDDTYTEEPVVTPEVPADQGGEVVLDGTGMDDGTVSEEGGEAAVEIPVLELTEADFTPDSGDGSIETAGINQIKVVYGNDNLVPVSGAFTVRDAAGNVIAAVDLADEDQVRTAALSEEGKVYYGWTEGTQLIINLDANLQASQSYTVVMDAVLAQTADPTVLEGVPTATVSLNWTINTDSYGANVNIAKVTDVYAGASLSGNVIMDETMAYANISSYDADKLAFDVVDFDLENTGFNMNCLASGNASFTIDYFDAEWTYLTSATVTVMIP